MALYRIGGLVAALLALATVASTSDQTSERPAVAGAADRLTFYHLELPPLHQADGQGTYDKLIQRASALSGVPTEHFFMPAERARRYLASCDQCCGSPVSNNPYFESLGVFMKSMPLGEAHVVAFTQRGQLPVSDIRALEAMTVAGVIGLVYSEALEAPGMVDVRVASFADAVELLERQRVDAVLGFVPEAYSEFERLGIEPTPHNADDPFETHRDSVMCRGSLAATFIKALDTLLREQGFPKQ